MQRRSVDESHEKEDTVSMVSPTSGESLQRIVEGEIKETTPKFSFRNPPKLLDCAVAQRERALPPTNT